MEKYQVGEIVTGCVTGIEKYGIFVNLDGHYSGLIHISEVSNSYVRNMDDYAKIGETIKVKILEENHGTHHLKLSIKDIDYRITKNKETKIEETKSGFSTLKIKLNSWIELKIKEIDNQKVEKNKKPKKY